MESQMIVRIDSDTKKKVSALAKAEGKTTSQVIRELLENYIRERDMSTYIDDLWTRIGTQLAAAGKGPKDVPNTIKAIRKGE